MYDFSLMPQVDSDHQIHLNRYFKFILLRPERNLKKEKGYHIHHIIPTALNGLDIKENKIKLTIREHYIAHMILFYCGYLEMISAFWFMIQIKENKNWLNSRQYQKLLNDTVILKSKRMKGKSFFEGKKHKAESIKKMSDFHIGKQIGKENSCARPVICVETKEIFDTMTEASIKYETQVSHIYECCNYNCINNKTVKGYHFQFLEDYLIKDIKTSTHGNAIKIKCIETKEVFNSLTEASNKYSIPTGNISKVCKKQRKTAGKLHWEYVID